MRGPSWLRTALDEEGGEIVETMARKLGVQVMHGDEIAQVIPKQGVPSYVKTNKGREIQTDLIGVGLGITLNTQCLAGTAVERRRGVVVNGYLEHTCSQLPGSLAIHVKTLAH